MLCLFWFIHQCISNLLHISYTIFFAIIIDLGNSIINNWGKTCNRNGAEVVYAVFSTSGTCVNWAVQNHVQVRCRHQWLPSTKFYSDKSPELAQQQSDSTDYCLQQCGAMWSRTNTMKRSLVSVFTSCIIETGYRTVNNQCDRGMVNFMMYRVSVPINEEGGNGVTFVIYYIWYRIRFRS